MSSEAVRSSVNKKTASLESDISEEALKERHYLWMARTFALVGVVAFLANLMLLGALFSLLPIMRIQPFYITTQDKDQQIINVLRPSKATLDSDMLQESLIRQYLLERLTMGTDIEELERRWGLDGLVNWMSSQVVAQEFVSTTGALLEMARRDGMTRNVNILSANVYRREADRVVWRIVLELQDMRKDAREPEKSRWIVNMAVNFQPNRPGLTWSQRLKNPLGFTVVNYGMTESKNG